MPVTEILRAPEQVRAIVPEWDALSLRDPATSPYDSGTLMTGLGDLAPCPGTPYVITARSDAGALIGVLPLRRARNPSRLGGSRLTGYTTWHTSYFDATIDPAVPGAGAALLGALPAQRDWDRCDLSFIRPDGNLLTMRNLMADSERTGSGSSRLVHPPADDAATGVDQVMSRKTAKRLARVGSVHFEPAVPIAQIPEALRRFAAMHTARWHGFGAAAEFSEPGNAQQLERVIVEAARAGWARVGTLSVAGEVIATHIAFRWRRTQYSWRMAHDAEWQARSPGRLLLSLMIADAFAAGCERCDLGRGEEPYKELWATETRPLVRVMLRGRTWRARLAALRAGA
ncbi:MAG: GNAT family N-acetyltransferase [Gemmatimonadota bacterium]